jgi:hypothetical protein
VAGTALDCFPGAAGVASWNALLEAHPEIKLAAKAANKPKKILILMEIEVRPPGWMPGRFACCLFRFIALDKAIRNLQNRRIGGIVTDKPRAEISSRHASLEGGGPATIFGLTNGFCARRDGLFSAGFLQICQPFWS